MDQLIQQKSEPKMILYFIRKKLIISIFFCGTYQMRNNAPDFLRKNWDETGPNIFNFIQLYNRYCQKIHSFFHQSVEFFWIFVWHLLSYLPFFSFLFSFNTCKKIGWFDFCYAIFHIIITVPFSFFVLQLYESSSDNSDSSNFFFIQFFTFHYDNRVIIFMLFCDLIYILSELWVWGEVKQFFSLFSNENELMFVLLNYENQWNFHSIE